MIRIISFLLRLSDLENQQINIDKLIGEIREIFKKIGIVEHKINKKNNNKYSFSYFLDENDQEKNKEGRIHIILNTTTQGRFTFGIHVDGAVHKLYKEKISKKTEGIINNIEKKILFHIINNYFEDMKEIFYINN